RSRAAANVGAHCADGRGASDRTGRTRERSRRPGRQTSRHSSQSARAASVTDVPAAIEGGGVMATASNTSPAYPKLVTGPWVNVPGNGHAMGPAWNPSGRVQASRVGNPESPG